MPENITHTFPLGPLRGGDSLPRYKAPLRHEADFAIPPGPGGYVVAVLITFAVGQLLLNVGNYAIYELYRALLEERFLKAAVALGLVGTIIAFFAKADLFKK